MQVHEGAHPLTVWCCTWRRIGPLVEENVVDQHAMVAADNSRIRGIINMPTTVLDPPWGGESRRRQKPAREGCHRLLVLQPKLPQRKRVLEEERRFRQIRIVESRIGKSIVFTIRRGLKWSRNKKGPTFMMKHKAKLMKVNTLNPNEVWYVNFWADEPRGVVLTLGEARTTKSCWNRQRNLTSHRACLWRTLKPCQPKRETNECLACVDNHQEFGASQIDHWPRNAGPIHPYRVLHQRRRENHCARAKRCQEWY